MMFETCEGRNGRAGELERCALKVLEVIGADTLNGIMRFLVV